MLPKMQRLLRATVVIAAVGQIFGGLVEAQSDWVIDPVPIMDIRGTNTLGELAFGMATGATRLSSGLIAVADGSTLSVRLFSSTGQLQRIVGRAGNGPGEFRSMMWIGSCGTDSVYVWDLGNRQMAVIGATGGVSRQFRFSSDSGPAPTPLAIGCAGPQHFAYTSVPIVREPTKTRNVFRGSTALVIADADGKPVRHVGVVAASEMAAMGGAGFHRPLGKGTSFAFAGDRVYVGTADSAAIDEYLAGGSKRPVLLRIPERTASQADLEKAIENAVAYVPPMARERAVAAMRAIAIPTHLPPYTGLLGDPEGLVWVILSASADSVTTLRAIGPGGKVVTDLRLPRAITVFEIGRDYLLGSYEDADLEPHVAVYRLRRGR